LAVREKAKAVMDLLANEKLIEEERENAKKIKERLNGKSEIL
jgi:epsin